MNDIARNGNFAMAKFYTWPKESVYIRSRAQFISPFLRLDATQANQCAQQNEKHDIIYCDASQF